MYEQLLTENEKLRQEVEHLRRDLEEARTKLSLAQSPPLGLGASIGSTPLTLTTGPSMSVASTLLTRVPMVPSAPTFEPDRRSLEHRVAEYEEELQVTSADFSHS